MYKECEKQMKTHQKVDNRIIIYKRKGLSQKRCRDLPTKVDSFKPKSDIHCNRSATSPRPKFKTIAEVAEESQLGFAVGRRLFGDWSATNRGLVVDWSATSRRPRGDLFATCCNWSPTGPRLVADESPIGRRPSQLKTVIKEKNIDNIFLGYIHTRQPTNPRSMPTNFYCLVGYDRVKKLPALIEERIYPRSTPAVSALYPWCTHAQMPLFPIYTRPSCRPIPALYDQPPTYSWCNYAHYDQYRTNPRFDFHSRPKMSNSSKCNANRQCYVGSVLEMRTWPILLTKSDLKWYIHLSRSLFLY